MSRLTGVFVGDSTLLLHCAELFERAGHSVAHICSRHPQVTIWANERGIPITRPVMGDRNSLELPLLQVSYDYLFSVANLQALSTAVISRAKILALNFHDGPLPRYAGLNAPQWALLAGERQHGITWHEMTIRPDTGRIAIQVQIAIDPDETVLSLNAKCYAAGASSFATLLSMAQGRTPMLTPQNGERTYFAKSHRPAQAGVIDVASSVKNVVRLVRALDCGSFWSPIANAKLTFGDTAISVRGAEPIEAPPGSEPGTIIASSTATIDVVLPDGGVRLHGLETLAGEPLEPDTLVAFEPGRRVQSLTLQQVKRIDEVAAASARSEPYWLSCIAQASALELSYPLVKAAFHSRASSLWHTRTLSASTMQLASSIGTTAAAALLAVQAAWLARLGAATHPHIAYADPGTVSAVAGVEAIFSPYRPAILAVTLDQSLRALADCAELEISGSKRHGPLAHDLIGRLARTNSPVSGQPLPNVALIVCGSSPGEIPPTSASHVLLMDAASGHITLSVSATHYSSEVADAMAAHFDHALTIACTMPDVPIGDLSLVPPAEALIFAAIDQAARYDFTTVTVDRAFAAQVRRTPERIAVRDRDNELSYRDLDTRVAAIAEALGAKNVGRGAIVGVSLERSTDMVATLIAIMRLGAAYVPIDPRFPLLRRRMIERDSRAHLIVIDRAQDCPDTPDRTITLRVDLIATKPLSSRLSELESSHSSSDLAYLMYTSGSTGVPKGVAVSHANVANFFAGMDQRIPASDRDGVWLAVTSISFDISVLELLWTITRGYTVALYDPNETPAKTGPSFSLFYFSAAADQNADTENGGTYRLLLEGSRFADANGFEAVWTPERHFHNFGGLYPNPAITGAAVAAITKNVSIRAGSCVLPLHDPIQIAEDWSVLDNLSNGRTGVAIASGWMPEDFVLQPEVFVNRHKTMLNHIDTIEKLWRGAVIERRKPSGELVPIRTMPRPIQPRLPMWLTAARNPETFRLAGERGFNVLTHLIGMTRAELAANIKHYHASRTKAGHSGRGRITLMLHTFVGTDEQAVRELVRAPMKRYLASSVELVRAAAWTFPTFVAQNSAGANGSDAFDLGGLSEAELDTVLEHAFSRYYEANGLFGSVQTCMQTAQDLIAIGVDEFACLIDFGVDTTIVL